MPVRRLVSPHYGSPDPAMRGRQAMQRAGRSPVWWLWAVGLLAFLLTAPSRRVRSPQDVPLASGVVDVADTGDAGRARIGIVVAAAALCVLLAVAVVAVLQVNQM